MLHGQNLPGALDYFFPNLFVVYVRRMCIKHHMILQLVVGFNFAFDNAAKVCF